MINHSNDKMIQWELKDDDFVMKSLRDIKKDEEIFECYGAKSNTRLMLSYGFCLENNPYNDFPVILELS